MRIMIVEDEQALSDGLRFNFEQEGYDVITAPDGPSALELFKDVSQPCDLVLLDLMLPGMSGYDICRTIREADSQVPILVLSARTLSEDKARAFDCGTDQYMTKPFELRELLSRVRNLLDRRPLVANSSSGTIANGVESFEFGNVHIDFTTFEVVVQGRTQSLTTMEVQLLKYFVENEGRVLPRNQILQDVWDDSSGITSRSIDNFVMRIRRLIEPDPADPCHILSVRGTGYRFVANP